MFQYKSLNYLVKTAEFERLKYIKQLGLLYFIFPNASHTRYQHSVGVAKLIINTFENLVNSGKIQMNKNTIEHIAIAGLLHDIGHGPFSHLYEKINPFFDHEKKSMEIIDSFPSGIFDKEFVKKCIHKPVYDNNEENENYVYNVVNSYNGFDFDKIDYLKRDAFYLNHKNIFNTDFLNSIKIIDNEIAYPESSYNDIIGVFNQRLLFHRLFYSHPRLLRFEHLFVKQIRESGVYISEDANDTIVYSKNFPVNVSKLLDYLESNEESFGMTKIISNGSNNTYIKFYNDKTDFSISNKVIPKIEEQVVF